MNESQSGSRINRNRSPLIYQEDIRHPSQANLGILAPDPKGFGREKADPGSDSTSSQSLDSLDYSNARRKPQVERFSRDLPNRHSEWRPRRMMSNSGKHSPFYEFEENRSRAYSAFEEEKSSHANPVLSQERKTKTLIGGVSENRKEFLDEVGSQGKESLSFSSPRPYYPHLKKGRKPNNEEFRPKRSLSVKSGRSAYSATRGHVSLKEESLLSEISSLHFMSHQSCMCHAGNWPWCTCCLMQSLIMLIRTH